MQKHPESSASLSDQIALKQLEFELAKIRKRKIKKMKRKILSGGYKIPSDRVAQALCYLDPERSSPRSP